ncbi:MAG: glycosyltransferase family 87 protein, partial [Gemmataceae bacterium]
MTLTRFLPRTEAGWHKLLLAILLLVFVIASIQYTVKVACDERDTRSAVVRWREHIDELFHGVNVYDRYTHPNTPFMALLLRPFTILPPVACALLWYYVKVGLTLLSIYWVFQLVATPGLVFPIWAKALALGLSIRPLLGDLSHGNVNLLILFLVVAMLYAFRCRRDLVAGLLLGAAITCKVTPLLFVPYFLWKRSWRVLAGCCAGLLLCFVLVPSLVFGPARNATLLTSWTKKMVEPFLVSGVVFYSEHHNQSLPGTIYRLATHSPSFSTYDDKDRYVPLAYHNLITLDTRVVPWLLKGCMGLFAIVVIWSCRTPTETRENWLLAAEFSIVILGMLLFSERTWKHHCVILLVPFTVLAHALGNHWQQVGLRRYLIFTLASSVALMSLTSTSLMGDIRGDMFLVYG